MHPHLQVGMRGDIPIHQFLLHVGGLRIDDVQRLRRDPARKSDQAAASLEDSAIGHRVDIDIAKGAESEIAVEIGPKRSGIEKTDGENRECVRAKEGGGADGFHVRED
jgi:hypothetical protein